MTTMLCEPWPYSASTDVVVAFRKVVTFAVPPSRVIELPGEETLTRTAGKTRCM